MALSYNLGYQESISVHPTRRQIFAGKPYWTFPNIWEWLILFFSTSASLEPSYVLRALGAEEDMAHSSIRSYVWKPLSTLTNISSPLFMHRKISYDLIIFVAYGNIYYKKKNDSCVRFGIGRFTSEDEVGFPMSCQHKTSRNYIPRWDTLLRGLWRKCLDWETCLLSGIWSRCASCLPTRLQYQYVSSGWNWSEDYPVDSTLIPKTFPLGKTTCAPRLVTYPFSQITNIFACILFEVSVILF